MRPNYRHSTVAQVDAKIEKAGALLCAGQPVRCIVRALRQQFAVSHRQARRYLAAARARIAREVNEARAVLVKRSLAVYQAVIDDPKARHADRIKARIAADIRSILMLAPFLHLGVNPWQNWSSGCDGGRTAK